LKDENRMITIVSAVFALVGLIIIVVGAAITISNQYFLRTAVEATAVITDIYTTRNSDGDTLYTVYVRFYVNDDEYVGQLGVWHSGMAIGQSVKIYYDPDNPYRFRSEIGIVLIVSLLLFGSIFLLVSFILFYRMKKRIRLSKSLLRDGQKVMAAFCDVEEGNLMMNGRTSFKLVCEYNDSFGQNSRLFKSENIWDNPLSFRDRQTMPAVPVYVNYNDYSKYYVDVDTFLAEIKR